MLHFARSISLINISLVQPDITIVIKLPWLSFLALLTDRFFSIRNLDMTHRFFSKMTILSTDPVVVSCIWQKHEYDHEKEALKVYKGRFLRVIYC